MTKVLWMPYKSTVVPGHFSGPATETKDPWLLEEINFIGASLFH